MLKAAESASDSANMATPGRLDALFDLSRKLAACLDLDDVLREVGLCASALTGAHAVSLERYDREARALVAFGSGAPAVDADTEAARRVLKTHEPELVEGPAGSSLLAALVSRGESVGVMRIRYHEHHEFAAHEVEFFRSLADVVASAIANALLYARLTRDISERERAEKELRAAEWRYRKLVEDMPVGTYVNSLEGRVTYISPHIEPVLGYTPEEWVSDGGALFSALLHPDDREWVEAISARCLSDGSVFEEEYRLIARDGRTVWVLDRTVQVCAPDGTTLFRQGFLLDITERKCAEERLAHLAYHDPLTGLPNRAMFNEHLELVLARARRTGSGAAVLFIDLDDFKLVNDSFGHSAGDELLRQVADRLGSVTRAGDLVARQGGDEFLILIGDFDGHRAEPEWMRTACDQIARKVQSALHAPFLVAGTELHTSASMGISVYPVDATDAEGMLKNGDIAMYKVKESGRDGYQMYASDGHDRVAQLSMAGRLRRGRRPRRDGAPLPAAGRAPDRVRRRRRGSGAVERPRPRDGAAARVHPPGRAHRRHRAALGLGDRGGLPAGRRVARAGARPLRVGEHASGAVAADGDAPRPEDDRAVRAPRRAAHDRDHGAGGHG